MKAIFVFCALALGVLISCSNSNSTNTEEKKDVDKNFLKEKMIDSNKHLSRTENNQIESFIERNNWANTKKLDNGIRIWEYKTGTGNIIEREQKVSLKYTLDLINGIRVYSSDSDGIKTFITGKAEVERGLDEAVQTLKKGSKAKIIIPSYLGFGYIGDGNKIPRYAILIYDIEIL